MIIESTASGLLGNALSLTVLFLVVALLAAAYRLIAGPTLSDRVVALDLISMLLVVFLVVFKMISDVHLSPICDSSSLIGLHALDT